MLLAVPNVSEGHDAAAVEAIAGNDPNAPLLDVHIDPDHNRGVLTYAGEAGPLAAAMTRMTQRAMERLDIRVHAGVHPRAGVVDVLPFVPYPGSLRGGARDRKKPHGAGPDAQNQRDAEEAAAAASKNIANDLGIPVYLYGHAHPRARPLPEARRAALDGDPPDLGPRAPHPAAGAICVGVRPPLLAFNVNLRGSLDDARAIAAAVRESDGGLPGVRALGFPLASRGLVQVSMNLTALDQTGPRAAFERVRDLAANHQLEMVGAEVVGLVPAAIAAQFDGIPLERPARTVETALAEATTSSKRSGKP
jgi:glutamate formiminotransferase